MPLGRALSAGRLFRQGSRWTLDFRDGAGRRRRQALSTDKRVAERLRADLIAKRDLQMAGLGAVEGQSMPLAELRDAYLADLQTRASAAHCVNSRNALERALREMRATRVRDVRPYEVLQLRAKLLGENLAHRTVNLHVDRLRGMLGWGVKVGLIAENPLAALERLPEGERHARYRRCAMSEDQIERFLAAAEADDRANEATTMRVFPGRNGEGPRARHERIPQAILFRALLQTAIRYGEARTLTWGDLDLDAGVMTLRAANTKAGRERQIPLAKGLVGELAELRELHGRVLLRPVTASDRVFLTPEGCAWCVPSNNIARVLERLLAAAGIERVDAQGRKLDLHALRHTAASRFARSGASLVVTQRILGHSDPKLTARVYTHLGVEDLRGAVEALPAAAPGKPRLALVPGEPIPARRHNA